MGTKKQIIKLINTDITVICALFYAITIIALFLNKDYFHLALSLVIPLIGVIFCSGLRNLINAKRPYELARERGEENFENLLDKKTEGKSFPSRHVFCIFIIATTIFYSQPILGIILFILGIVLCILRVKAKVHFIKDVVAGAALGIVIGSFIFIF